MRQLLCVLFTLIFAMPSIADSIEYGIIKLVDRGRLTPFGRTYDIYLDTEGRVPSFLHAGRSWICDPDNDDGPFDTLGKENKDAWIEIENVEGKDPLWFNYGSTTNPLSDVRTNGIRESIKKTLTGSCQTQTEHQSRCVNFAKMRLTKSPTHIVVLQLPVKPTLLFLSTFKTVAQLIGAATSFPVSFVSCD
jgi:hypothetical protein